MKLNYWIRFLPFLSTLLIIVFLSISNQKDYTKIRILIWNSPSLKLGNYLALSTASGFILSYLLTSNLAKKYQTTPKQSLKFKEEENHEENNEYIQQNRNLSYDNILIERDSKDPSPTINANFRILGKIARSNDNNINKKSNNNFKFDSSYEIEEQYNEQTDRQETINNEKSISSDWNDDSYSNW